MTCVREASSLSRGRTSLRCHPAVGLHGGADRARGGASDLYAFRLWGLLSPGEPRVEAEVIDQIRVAIETRSNEE